MIERLTITVFLGGVEIKADGESVTFKDSVREEEFEYTWEEIYRACYKDYSNFVEGQRKELIGRQLTGGGTSK